MNLIRPDQESILSSDSESNNYTQNTSQEELNQINNHNNNIINSWTDTIIQLKKKHDIPLTEVQEKYNLILQKIKNSIELVYLDLNFIFDKIEDYEWNEDDGLAGYLLGNGIFLEDDILQFFKSSNMEIKKILLKNFILLNSDFNNARISYFKEMSYNLKKNIDKKSSVEFEDCGM
tara:strand:+ start:149 stop:676 length:528 start_codon:yes stop_codon:yes gene_type:complete